SREAKGCGDFRRYFCAAEFVADAFWRAARVLFVVGRHSLFLWNDGVAVSLSLQEAEGPDAADRGCGRCDVRSGLSNDTAGVEVAPRAAGRGRETIAGRGSDDYR